MKYLTTGFTKDFQVNTTPSFRRQVNGMSTKTCAIKHALNCEVITSIDPLYDLWTVDLLIEPLFFREYAAKDAFKDCMDVLNVWEGKKVLLCSEMEPLRWKGKYASEIINEMDTVLASCQYQAKLLESLGVRAEKVVYEPVNERLFFPASEKEDWVVVIGSPTLMKNADALIEVFKGLEGSGLKRIYVGGPIVWGKLTQMKNEFGFDNTMKNHARLKEACDVYYRPSSQIFIAYLLSKAKYYLNFAYHEVCCRSAMEAMLCGVGILAGKHPIFEEYPCVATGLTPSECVELIVEGKPDVKSDLIRDWALDNVSSTAFRQAIGEVLS